MPVALPVMAAGFLVSTVWACMILFLAFVSKHQTL
jgi:hypothetical protein